MKPMGAGRPREPRGGRTARQSRVGQWCTPAPPRTTCHRRHRRRRPTTGDFFRRLLPLIRLIVGVPLLCMGCSIGLLEREMLGVVSNRLTYPGVEWRDNVHRTRRWRRSSMSGLWVKNSVGLANDSVRSGRAFPAGSLSGRPVGVGYLCRPQQPNAGKAC